MCFSALVFPGTLWSHKQKQPTGEFFCPSSTKCERQTRQQRRRCKPWFTTYFWHHGFPLAPSTYLLNYFWSVQEHPLPSIRTHTSADKQPPAKRRAEEAVKETAEETHRVLRAPSCARAGASAAPSHADSCQSGCPAAGAHPESCDRSSSEAASGDCTRAARRKGYFWEQGLSCYQGEIFMMD